MEQILSLSLSLSLLLSSAGDAPLPGPLSPAGQLQEGHDHCESTIVRSHGSHMIVARQSHDSHVHVLQDSVLECGNANTLRAGLKDAGLQPGEVISVLDYLERRREVRRSGLPTSRVPQTPPSPQTPHRFPPSPSVHTPQYHHQMSSSSAPGTPGSPHHFPFPTSYTGIPTASHPPQQHSLPTNQVPPTVLHSPQHHSLPPTRPPGPPVSQFTPAYRVPTRLPTPGELCPCRVTTVIVCYVLPPLSSSLPPITTSPRSL